MAAQRARIACSALSIAILAAFALSGCDRPEPYEPATPSSTEPIRDESIPAEQDMPPPEATPPETETENIYPEQIPPYDDQAILPEPHIPEQPIRDPEPDPTTDDAPPDR
ncbi:hypothetical protein [Marilutibacter alkalisoli]|uniref:Uncharacterized protein n=1 Tax=Marilutibacter alkalisoli TaxID=2591633 RepID=A0A514BPM8_9GAMM|nr:hypothetical protein [Lysobacter alkalisoli]QDH69334.1 hypothetical protein FKV23_03885 [Lysobacter alkalisoli]